MKLSKDFKEILPNGTLYIMLLNKTRKFCPMVHYILCYWIKLKIKYWQRILWTVEVLIYQYWITNYILFSHFDIPMMSLNKSCLLDIRLVDDRCYDMAFTCCLFTIIYNFFSKSWWNYHNALFTHNPEYNKKTLINKWYGMFSKTYNATCWG